MQSVSITTNIVSSNSIHGEVYSIQHYVIKFVSDLVQVRGFSEILKLKLVVIISFPIKSLVYRVTILGS